MKMSKLYAIVSLLTLLLGCTPHNDNYRQYQPHQIIDSLNVLDISDAVDDIRQSLDSITEKIDIIALETNTQSIVSSIEQILTTDEYIYILDNYKNGSVVVFRIDGSFVERIPTGSAPHELGRPIRLFFDTKDSVLYIYDDGNKRMSRFSSSGSFVDYDTVNAMFTDFAVLNGSYIMIQPSYQSYTGMFSVRISDSNSVDYWMLGDDYEFTKITPYVHYCDNEILITAPKDDHIFCYDGNKIYRKYKIRTNKDCDYAKYENPVMKWEDLSLKEFFFGQRITVTRNYQLFQVVHRLGICADIIRNIENGDVWFELYHNTLFFEIDRNIGIGVHNYANNVFNGVISPCELLSDHDDNRWDGSNPNGLISDADMEKLRNVKPDDNPIIVLFKLKDEI